MTWRVSLDGNGEDLKLLERTFNGDPKIVKDSDYGKYFLESSNFDDLEERPKFVDKPGKR